MSNSTEKVRFTYPSLKLNSVCIFFLLRFLFSWYIMYESKELINKSVGRDRFTYPSLKLHSVGIFLIFTEVFIFLVCYAGK